MCKKMILLLIVLVAVVSFVESTNYQKSIGPLTVEFNSSKNLLVQVQTQSLPEAGLNKSMAILSDNSGHTVGYISAYNFSQINPVNDVGMDLMIDNIFEGFASPSAKQSIKIDNTSGRQAEGYSSGFGRIYRVAIYPYNKVYDTFYNQYAANSWVVYESLQDPADYNEIIASLHVGATGIKVDQSLAEPIAKSLTGSSQKVGRYDEEAQISDNASIRPVSGEWTALTKWGKLAFVVNNNSSSISSITLNFTNLECGGVTSSGNTSMTYRIGLPIKDGQFISENKYGDYYGASESEKEITIIQGRFDETGKHASGKWEKTLRDESCQCTWEAEPAAAQKI
jgi:hypothetical protein